MEKELLENLNLVAETHMQAYRAGFEAGHKKGKEDKEREFFEAEEDGIAAMEEN